MELATLLLVVLGPAFVGLTILIIDTVQVARDIRAEQRQKGDTQ